jgi:hypothetical protein
LLVDKLFSIGFCFVVVDRFFVVEGCFGGMGLTNELF